MARKANANKLDKYRLEREKNHARISVLQARNQELDKLITETENTQIIAAVRSVNLGPEELAALLQGLRKQCEVPVFTQSEPQEDEEYEG